jgi:energy-coupling factor transporter ATP-binding protein EcfA2
LQKNNIHFQCGSKLKCNYNSLYIYTDILEIQFGMEAIVSLTATADQNEITSMPSPTGRSFLYNNPGVKFVNNKRIWFNTAQPSSKLSGRVQDRQAVMDIYDTLQESGTQACVLLSGESGVGKSELAKQIATDIYRKENNSSVLSINDFKRSIFGLAELLGIESAIQSMIEITPEELFKESLSRLRLVGPVLVIIDGGSEITPSQVSSLIKASSELPPGDNPPLILAIMSSPPSSTIFDQYVLHINLQNLSELEAKQIIKSVFSRSDDECIDGIYKVTGGQPSTINKALSHAKLHTELSQNPAKIAEFAILTLLSYYFENANGTYVLSIIRQMGLALDQAKYVAAAFSLIEQGLFQRTLNQESIIITPQIQQVIRNNTRYLFKSRSCTHCSLVRYNGS